MSGGTALIVGPVVDASDFSRFGTVADIGGGQGALLASILRSSPASRGLLFDGSAAIRDARTADSWKETSSKPCLRAATHIYFRANSAIGMTTMRLGF